MKTLLCSLALLLPAPLLAQSIVDQVRDKTPWRRLEANSDQRQPVYLGRAPLELELGTTSAAAALPDYVRSNGEKQARHALAHLGLRSAELEFWPARDDEGFFTLALARWRTDSTSPWNWLFGVPPLKGSLQPFFPRPVKPWEEAGAKEIFSDPLAMDSLYDKPVFGDCLWTDPTGASLSAGWLETSSRESYKGVLAATGARQLCIVLPQPAMLDGKPATFVLSASSKGVRWPAGLVWEKEARPKPAKAIRPRWRAWPRDFHASYRRDVEALSGEAELVFKSGERLRLSRKSSAQPDHQLERLMDWLTERYSDLGIATRRERFSWRGIPQSNLTAVIEGSLPPEKNRPVLLVDHVDTAFCADLFAAEKRRVSAPGADDNGTATAALLAAARQLRDLRPKHDIWLVHLTGEEFPADDLGARENIRGLLAARRRLGAVVVLDMLGYRDRGDRVFQVNAGAGADSLGLARVSMALSAAAAPFKPRLRTRFDPESYLYNTDALIYSDAGYPTILINEHINARHNLRRRHYHETTDVVKNVDFGLAEALSRLAIETAAHMALKEEH